MHGEVKPDDFFFRFCETFLILEVSPAASETKLLDPPVVDIYLLK